MQNNDFCGIPMPEVPAHVQTKSKPWLWRGYLYPRDITLMTSQWKTGKTTLITGLLQALEHDGDSCDLHCATSASRLHNKQHLPLRLESTP